MTKLEQSEHLKKFTRLKNGNIVYVVKRMSHCFHGFNLASEIMLRIPYSIEDEDPKWKLEKDNKKIAYLKDNFKPANFYGITNAQRRHLTIPQRIHGILVQILFLSSNK